MAAIQIRQINCYLPIKTPRAKQCAVQNIRAIRSSNYNHTLVPIKAIHFNKKRIQSLFTLIIAAAKTRATLTPYRIDFINENNTRRIFTTLLKHITHTRRANTNKHFDKIRTAYRVKRNIGFPCYCLRKQGFTRSWRTDHENAFRNTSPDTLKLLRILKEINNFRNLLLRFITTSNIFKSNRIFVSR